MRILCTNVSLSISTPTCFNSFIVLLTAWMNAPTSVICMDFHLLRNAMASAIVQVLYFLFSTLHISLGSQMLGINISTFVNTVSFNISAAFFLGLCNSFFFARIKMLVIVFSSVLDSELFGLIMSHKSSFLNIFYTTSFHALKFDGPSSDFSLAIILSMVPILITHPYKLSCHVDLTKKRTFNLLIEEC